VLWTAEWPPLPQGYKNEEKKGDTFQKSPILVFAVKELSEKF